MNPKYILKCQYCNEDVERFIERSPNTCFDCKRLKAKLRTIHYFEKIRLSTEISTVAMPVDTV